MPPAHSRTAVLFLGALIALAVVAAYANAIHGAFVYDDLGSIVENPTLRTFSRAWHPPAGGLPSSGRPLLNFSFALNYAISGTQPLGYHITNIAIHACAALVLFGFLRRTLQLTSAPHKTGSAALPLSFIVTLLWALHPLQTESVTYISQRAESLAALFILLALYGFVRGVTDEAHANRWPALSLCAGLLGAATKETAAVAPLLVLLFDRTFVSGSFRTAWQKHRAFHGGLALSWLVLAALVISNPDRGGTAGIAQIARVSSYLMQQGPALLHYLQLSVWPAPLIFDYGIEPVATNALLILAADAFILALLTLTLVALYRRSALGFLGASFFLLLAPSSSFVPIATELIAEHRTYLPLAAVLTLLVLTTWRWLGSHFISLGIAAALVLGGLTLLRNRDYSSELALWQDTAVKRPGNARAHFNLGVALARVGRAAEAIPAYEVALRLRPTLTDAHVALGETYFQSGDLAAALTHFQAAVQAHPGRADGHDRLATTLDRLGRTAEALDHYQQALQLDPRNADACFHFGNLLARQGRFAAAAEAYRNALDARPDFSAARANLARVQSLIPKQPPPQ